MVDKPDIVKRLMEEEKLGKLEGSSQGSHEELEVPEELPEISFEDMSDETVNIGEEKKFTNHNDTETGFQASEDTYHLIAENTSDLISMTTFKMNPTYIYVNPSYKRILGYEPEDMIGKPTWDFMHPDDKKNLTPLIKKYLSMKAKKLFTGKEHEIVEKFECRLRDKSGNWHYIENTGNIVNNEMLFVSKDVTERKKAEEELRETKNHFQTLFNSMVDPVMIIDSKGKFLELTERVKEITGWDREDIIGKNFLKTKFLTRKSKAIFIKNLLKRMSGINVIPYEVEALTKDGRKLPFEINAERIEYKGKPADMIVFRDISDRKQAEWKLKETNERLELAMDVGEHGFWDWNLDTDDVYFSPRYYTMLGYEPGELPMRLETWVDLMHPEDGKDIVPRVQKYVENAEPYEVEFRLKCKDGSWKWISGRGKTFEKGEKGVPYRAVGVHVDITERKMAEEKMKEAQKLLKTLNANLERKVRDRTAEVEKLLKQKDEFVNQLGHDLKNPLGPLINLIPVLEKDETDSKRKEIFEVLNRNTNHMKNLATKTIQLARGLKISRFEIFISPFSSLPFDVPPRCSSD